MLVEPNNVHASLERQKSWFLQKEYEKACEAGEHTLKLSFLPEQSALKEEAYYRLKSAYWYAQKYSDVIRIYDRLLQEFPSSGHNAADMLVTRAMALLYLGRRDEAVAALEAAVKDESVRADPQKYFDALYTLHTYYMREKGYIVGTREYQQRRDDPEYLRVVSQRTKHAAERFAELFEVMMKELEGRRDGHAAMWAYNCGLHGLTTVWIDESGRTQRLFTSEQRKERLLRIVKTFSWATDVCYEAHTKLADVSDYLGDWEQAMQSYQYLVDHPEHHSGSYSLPNIYDLGHYAPSDAISSQIYSRFKIASILRDHKQQPDVAIREFQKLIHDFGVTNHRGVNTVAALDKLGASFEFPEKAALVWGGGPDALVAWGRVLEPLGYTVHHVEQYQISAAHLAPYQIVILVRTGRLPYEPTDALALRSYVATGGSLLVVVSPGWHNASPGIHNPVLTFFDAHAGQEMVVRANSTRIVPHPITTGAEQVMAKNAVHLTVPTETALIEAGDRTVLAAMPYRHGRVVIASFGQWFQPGPGRPGWRLAIDSTPGRTTATAPDKCPYEDGPGLHMPLLRNVVAWLDEPHASGKIGQARQPFVNAHRAGLLDQFRVKPRAELAAAMDDLIASVPEGDWKEEALWVAGESCLQQFYLPRKTGSPFYGWVVSEPRHVESRYFQRLVEQFPNSPLRGLAQWRLADCKYRQLLDAGRSSSTVPATDRQAVIDAFLRVDAPQGSHAWAWSRLRVGAILFKNGDFSSAAVHYHEVAERMPNGAEKSLALLHLSVCYEAVGKIEEARRYEKLVLSVPDIYWWTSSGYEDWAPMRMSGAELTDTTHDFIKRMKR